MKLLLDENLSPRLARSMSDLFPESLHVADCGLGASDDAAIWRFAAETAFAILTCSTVDVESLIRRTFASIRDFVQDPDTACLVITQRAEPRNL